MTLILTRASKDYVLQVTDRLLTTQGKQFDPISNKNILFLTRDAVVTMGYTGLAYIGDVPTDQWIVETLTGIKYDRERKPPALSAGMNAAIADIGRSVTNLRAALESAPIAPKFSSYWKARSFDVSIAGYQWTARRRRPVVMSISKREGATAVTLSRQARYWHYERSPDRKAFRFTLTAAPAANISGEQGQRLLMAAANCLPDQSEAALVGSIREVATVVPEVGSHCMSILILDPKLGGARVRYIPAGGPAVAAISTATGQNFQVPAAFSPWIVSPMSVHAPSTISGSVSLSFGGYPIQLEAPEPHGPFHAVFSSQKRPKMP